VRLLLAACAVGTLCGCGRAPEPAKAPRPPLVLLVTLDTTRADRLSCYGYSRGTTPQLDRLAADALLFENALATSSWTLPSHATLFTGKLGSVHGAGYDAKGPLSLAAALPGSEWERYRARPLDESERTLAEMLKDAGYATGGVVAGPWMKKPFGLAQGFDFWDDDQIDSTDGRRADKVSDAALRFLERTKGPAFLFLNYYDPHGPYDAPEPFARRFLAPGARLSGGVPKGEELQARYDAELAFLDEHVGRLLEGLRGRGLYDAALILVTADHGELLGEHDRLGHGETLTEPELRIPFLIKYPNAAKRGRTTAPAQLSDALPTLLDSLTLEIPKGLQGGVLPKAGHPVVAEVDPLPEIGPAGRWRALYDGPRKFLWNSKGNHQLFDLASDPGEKQNLFGRDAEQARRLAAGLEGYLAALPKPPASAVSARALDEETQKALRSLGYVR
jgi:arylsulfatase A-like enzyme